MESKYNSCKRQTIKHDGKLNSPMIFNISGSSVIYKEYGNWAMHGIHGNGFDFDGYMFKSLQLLQTQNRMDVIWNTTLEWQNRYAWCLFFYLKKPFALGKIKEVKQLGFGKTILDNVKPSFSKLIDQSKAIILPDF